MTPPGAAPRRHPPECTGATGAELEPDLTRSVPHPDEGPDPGPDPLVAHRAPGNELDAVRRLVPCPISPGERTTTGPRPVHGGSSPCAPISTTRCGGHLDGSAVRPWRLPDRLCTFATRSNAPAIDRVFVALEDASEDPRPETARAR